MLLRCYLIYMGILILRHFLNLAYFFLMSRLRSSIFISHLCDLFFFFHFHFHYDKSCNLVKPDKLVFFWMIMWMRKANIFKKQKSGFRVLPNLWCFPSFSLVVLIIVLPRKKVYSVSYKSSFFERSDNFFQIL